MIEIDGFQGYDMLKANPMGGAGASYLPPQFGAAIELVMAWPFHRNI